MRLTRLRIVFLAALIVLGTTAATSTLAMQNANQGGLVFADFQDASPMLPLLEVKVHGVTVGTTGAPTIDQQRGISVIPLELGPGAFPLHSDATAEIAPVSILGERYIELNPGSPGAPELAPGQHVRTSQTSRWVEFQDVVDTLDDPTSAALAALTVTFGQAMRGNGDNIQKTLAALAPAMGNTDQLVTVLKEQNALLGDVIDRSQPVTAALAADDGKVLDHVVGSADQLLRASSVQDRALDATVRELPDTLAEAQRALTALTGTARSTGTTLRNLRPATDNLTALSHELQDFSETASPALSSSNAVFERANELLDEARPVVRDLRAGGSGLRSTVGNLRPIVDKLDGNLGNIMGFIRNWALTTNGRDGLSHYFRAHYVLSPQEGTGNLPGGTPKALRLPPGLNHGNIAPPGLLPPQKSPNGSATGLQSDQEKGALGFLMGGE